MVKPIKTEAEYEVSLARIYELLQQEVRPDSDAEAELEVRSLLVREYEREHHPVPPPHPIEAIRFRMDQLGLKESDLNRILGSRSRKSDVLSGRRKLSLSMIRRLHEKLNIPAEALIAAY